ncbi:hypothetical protein RFI_29623 [Reticulomyxa filosa]|uniref:Kelch motif family protein n=1 Tax=Reticulomyxa filosa TaxID=46433 RepID=X6M2G1_RETFI|nr:hypothetical protein RFI_29623 [Reticulomyxa filosa]|eukprot:ETO07766.1 hypothetical protein RFI_29623 [Reticulomyxa filosa]
MGNRTAAQKSPKIQTEQTEQSQHLITSTSFQSLKELPTSLSDPQCVLYKHELLICGGIYQRACYSYHTLKNEYKFICEYPIHIRLEGHCVVKLVDKNNKNSNQVTLLSFGGSNKHALAMKYVSVWNDISSNLNNCNQWVPFTNNRNHPIIIGRYFDSYLGARAVIGGSNNHLLFITYPRNNISVFDLNTFQFIQHDTLPTDNYIDYHCFISNSENRQRKEMMKTNEEKNKQIYQMMLFCRFKGLSIEYNEDDNNFQFHQLNVCDDIGPLYRYAYVCTNNIILFFGGCSQNGNVISKSVHKYSIQEDKWMTFQNALHSPLCDCAAILSEKDDHIHIIGGVNDKKITVSTHMKTKVCIWDSSLLVMMYFFIYFHETQINFISKNDIKYIIQCWIRISKIKLGWIDDFDKIVTKYIRIK